MEAGRMLRPLSLTVALLSILVVLTSTTLADAQIQPPTVFEINGARTIRVLDNGTAMVNETIRFSAEAYVRFKQVYNPLSVLVRELEPRTSPTHIVDLNIKADDANNKIELTYKILGLAVYKGDGKWQVRVAGPEDRVTLSSHNGNSFVFVNVVEASTGFSIIETITVELPEDASNARYLEDEKILEYTLNPETAPTASSYARYLGIALIIAGVLLTAYSFGLLGVIKRAPPAESRESGINNY